MFSFRNSLHDDYPKQVRIRSREMIRRIRPQVQWISIFSLISETIVYRGTLSELADGRGISDKIRNCGENLIRSNG